MARTADLSVLPALQFIVLEETVSKTEEVSGATGLHQCGNDATRYNLQLANPTESGCTGMRFSVPSSTFCQMGTGGEPGSKRSWPWDQQKFWWDDRPFVLVPILLPNTCLSSYARFFLSYNVTFHGVFTVFFFFLFLSGDLYPNALRVPSPLYNWGTKKFQSKVMKVIVLLAHASLTTIGIALCHKQLTAIN